MEEDDVLEVQCAGCGDTLEVERGLMEFACPGCATPQALPPELMPPPPPRPRRALPLGPVRWSGPSTPPSARVPCDGCGAVLAVPRGIWRVACPLCGDELDVDRSSARISAVQVVSQPRAVAIAAASSRLPEEEPISQVILTGQVQGGRYNKPIYLKQSGVPFANYSAREEPSSSHRSNTRTAIHVDQAKHTHTSQSVHREESRINLLNETVDGNDFRERCGPSAGHGFTLYKQGKNGAAGAQEVSSNYLVHREEVHGENQSGTTGRVQIRKARHAAISIIREQEVVDPSVQIAYQELVGFDSCGDRTEWNRKRKRSSRTTTGTGSHNVKKGGFNCSNEEIHLTCSNQTQPECARIRNPVQHRAPSEENSFDPSDVNKIAARLCPSSLPLNRLSQARSNGLKNNDATLPPISISDDGDSQQPQEEPHIVQRCKNTEKASTKQSNEGANFRDQPHDAHQQAILVTACSNPATDLSQLLTATPHISPTVATRSTVQQTPQEHQCSDTLQSQVAPNALMGSINKSSKKRRGRGPTKLMEPRREDDRPVLIPNNTDTWDVDPPCPKVASTISALLKQWHPGSTSVFANHQTHEVHQEQLILHWHHYPPDTRATIMEEFLQRYKWALGHEAVCLKLFDRKIVRQFTALLCDEKRRVRVEFEKKAKVASDAANARSKQTNLNDEDARKKLKQSHRDPAAVGGDHDDPLQWKPFPPEWMQPKWWEMLCEHWASEEALQVSAQKRKNRYTGGSAQHTAGSRTIAMHRKLMIIENDGKPVSDIEVFNKTHKRDGGKGEFVNERAKNTVERVKRRLEEAGDAGLDPHLVWVQEVGGRDRGRYYGLHGIIDKARIDAMAKSTPGCVDKKTRKEMFTQDQVQEMISQALQQLNETWEKRFQSLEQKMQSMVSPKAPEHALPPCTARAGAEGSASHQDASDPSNDGTYRSATDDDEDDEDC